MEAKVREYWVVYPEDKGIDVHLYDKGHFLTRIYGVNGPDVKENERAPEIIPVTVLPGLEIDTKEIFQDKL
jgi:Uma2 family endonuclease